MLLAGLSRTVSILRPNINLVRNSPEIIRHASVLTFLERFNLKPSKTKANKANLNLAGIFLYEQIADKIDYPSFFQKYNMPNTYNSWFLVTELHVWMVLARVMAIEEGGRILRNNIVETLWEDSRTRAKQLQADNPRAMRKQLEILSQQFQAALITYDDGLMHDDKSLATSLWVRLFDKNCDNYEHLETLVEYVRRQMQMLDNMREEELLYKPKIAWENITDFKVPPRIA